jgi:gamma-glutamylcyclotransferase (GGCT)/AIG2-like uncharacterized protein YtfP
MKTRKIAVYGSLREGQYNFERFKQAYPEIKVVKNNHRIEGFQLYSLGAYPAIKYGKGSVEIDVLEVPQRCFGQITAMELGAGYSALEIFIDNEQVVIYPYEQQVDPRRLVESGNWNEYTNKKA